MKKELLKETVIVLKIKYIHYHLTQRRYRHFVLVVCLLAHCIFCTEICRSSNFHYYDESRDNPDDDTPKNLIYNEFLQMDHLLGHCFLPIGSSHCRHHSFLYHTIHDNYLNIPCLAPEIASHKGHLEFQTILISQ